MEIKGEETLVTFIESVFLGKRRVAANVFSMTSSGKAIPGQPDFKPNLSLPGGRARSKRQSVKMWFVGADAELVWIFRRFLRC